MCDDYLPILELCSVPLQFVLFVCFVLFHHVYIQTPPLEVVCSHLGSEKN